MSEEDKPSKEDVPMAASEDQGDKDTGDNSGEDKKKKKKSRSRSRSRKRSRKSRRSSRSRSRDRRDRSRKRRSSRSRSRDKDRDRDRRRRDRSKSPRREKSRREKTPPKPPTEEEIEAEKKRKEMEAERMANKELYTVFVSQIHPKIGEKDLYEFFTIVGRVEDIRLIRDQKTKKSKGLCYVEFWERDSVHKATALSGQLLGGYPITIQVCEAEQKAATTDNVPTKLYVGQLHYNVAEEDIKPLFEAFGPIVSVELHKDPATGQSKGFGFVTFQNSADANVAKDHLDGFEVAGKAIKVNKVEDNSGQQQGSLAMDDGDGDSGLAMTALSRAQLMQKLQRGNEMGLPSALQPQKAPAVVATPCVLVRNMFDPKGESEPNWDQDIKEDVEDECSKFGALKHIYVDKNSLGNVYLRFYNSTAAEGIVKAFHGRWFASRQIQAGYMEVATYDRKFPESAAAS